MPMNPKDVLRYFRTAAWGSPQELEAFAAEVGEQPPKELLRLLDLLLDRSLTGDLRAHADRCVAFRLVVERAPNPELFVPFVKALRQGDTTLRTTLAQLLIRVNSPPKHGELCAVLGAPDPELRKFAAAVLKQVGGQTAFEVLQTLVRERSFSGRIEAIDTLAPKAGHHAIPLLGAVAESGDAVERAHALRYLGDARLMVKDVRGALEAIVPFVDDEDGRVTQQAMLSLSAMATETQFFEVLGSRIETTSTTKLKAIIDALKRYDSPRTLEYLTQRFRTGPSSIRMAILDALSTSGQETALPLLVEALSNRRIDVRTRAAEVLSELAQSGRADVARTIVWLLRNRDTNVRRIAVEIARKVGDKTGELTPRLLRFLRDEDWWVRERVMDALAEMAGQALTRHLVDFLQDPSDVVRRFAIGGMRRLSDQRALGALVRCAMSDSDWWVREEAIAAIGNLKDERAVPYLLEILSLHPEERLMVIHALTAIGAKSAAQRVADFLPDADAGVRYAAIECLGKLDDRTVGPKLKACELDEVFKVRSAAQELLMRWNFISEAAQGVESEATNILDRMLVALAQAGADDLIVSAGRPPHIKKLGTTSPFSKTIFNEELVRAILLPHLSVVQGRDLEEGKDVDLSYEVKTHKLRFRAHIFHQMSGLSAVFRIVKHVIPSIDALGLPPSIIKFGDYKNGLVLVGGPTGSGKSTTLAALIDYVNATSAQHIVTIEDPIEVVHAAKKSLINQREVGSHTPSFAAALRSTLRQDPDVILVGELRDLQTISFAVSAAETGHLVFGTVHTVSADTSIDRLINNFPPGQQPQVRAMLADTLRAVLCQHLVRNKEGHGRSLAVEVMLNTDATANLIRKGKTFQIPSVIATSRELGMQSMDSDLLRLFRASTISFADAYAKANDKKAFETLAGAASSQMAEPTTKTRGTVVPPDPTTKVRGTVVPPMPSQPSMPSPMGTPKARPPVRS